MIFKPCCPRAGPTGGLGLAPPAGTWRFDYCHYFFCHYAFSTWEKLSSTGVDFPKILTETLMRFFRSQPLQQFH